MPSSAENWYCEHIVSGPWPFVLLILPLVGAYLYGQSKQRLAWMLIGAWVVIQVPMSFVNNILVNCHGDAPAMEEPLSEAPPQSR